MYGCRQKQTFPMPRDFCFLPAPPQTKEITSLNDKKQDSVLPAVQTVSILFIQLGPREAELKTKVILLPCRWQVRKDGKALHVYKSVSICSVQPRRWKEFKSLFVFLESQFFHKERLPRGSCVKNSLQKPTWTETQLRHKSSDSAYIETLSVGDRAFSRKIPCLWKPVFLAARLGGTVKGILFG